MKPPEATQARQSGQAGDPSPVVSLCVLQTLRNRSDFLKASRAERRSAPAFTVQARQRHPDETAHDLIRVGYTCSKKVGNAVARNRAKRRLREIARAVLSLEGTPGWDYVLIGRPGSTASRPLTDLQDDLSHALNRIHSTKP